MKKNARYISLSHLALAIGMVLTGCTTVRPVAGSEVPETRLPYARNVYLNEKARQEAALRQSMVDKATEYLGIRYRYGCQTPEKGFDCSGLVYHVALQNDVHLPRSSASQSKHGQNIPWKKTTTGDLVFFGQKGRINHVGIVQENTGKSLIIIHSTTRKGVISEDVLSSAYWKKRIRHGANFSTML